MSKFAVHLIRVKPGHKCPFEGRFIANKQILLFTFFFTSIYREFFLCYLANSALCLRHLQRDRETSHNNDRSFPRRVANRPPQNTDHADYRLRGPCRLSTFFLTIELLFSVLQLQRVFTVCYLSTGRTNSTCASDCLFNRQTSLYWFSINILKLI